MWNAWFMFLINLLLKPGILSNYQELVKQLKILTSESNFYTLHMLGVWFCWS